MIDEVGGRLYRTGEAARILGVSRRTVSRWCRSGAIKCCRRGGRYYISRDELLRFSSAVRTGVDRYAYTSGVWGCEGIDGLVDKGLEYICEALEIARGRGVERRVAWNIATEILNIYPIEVVCPSCGWRGELEQLKPSRK
jgi:excisionase family DNA binding protein